MFEQTLYFNETRLVMNAMTRGLCVWSEKGISGRK